MRLVSCADLNNKLNFALAKPIQCETLVKIIILIIMIPILIGNHWHSHSDNEGQ